MMRPNSIGSANSAAASRRLANARIQPRRASVPEHGQHADIEADEIHLNPSGRRKSARNPILSAQLKPCGRGCKAGLRESSSAHGNRLHSASKRSRTSMTKRPSKTPSAVRVPARRPIETPRAPRSRSRARSRKAKAAKEASNAEDAEAASSDADVEADEAEKAKAEAAEAEKTEAVDKKIEELDERGGRTTRTSSDLRRKYMLRRFWHTARRFWTDRQVPHGLAAVRRRCSSSSCSISPPPTR